MLDTTYMAAVNEYPLLTAEQEQELARAVQRGKRAEGLGGRMTTRRRFIITRAMVAAHEARETLVLHNQRLVMSAARKFPHLDQEECIQEGNIGLMRAATDFEPGRGRFSTYALWWIRRQIIREVAQKQDLIRVPVHRHEKAQRARRAGETEQGASVYVYSLDRRVRVGDSKSATLLDLYADRTHAPEPTIDALDADERHTQLRAAWQHAPLTTREREVLTLRYADDDVSLADVATALGISRERARTLQHTALRKIRVALGLAEELGAPHGLCTLHRVPERLTASGWCRKCHDTARKQAQKAQKAAAASREEAA
jgi:RNA polymerase primary sigma factor